MSNPIRIPGSSSAITNYNVRKYPKNYDADFPPLPLTPESDSDGFEKIILSPCSGRGVLLSEESGLKGDQDSWVYVLDQEPKKNHSGGSAATKAETKEPSPVILDWKNGKLKGSPSATPKKSRAGTEEPATLDRKDPTAPSPHLSMHMKFSATGFRYDFESYESFDAHSFRMQAYSTCVALRIPYEQMKPWVDFKIGEVEEILLWRKKRSNSSQSLARTSIQSGENSHFDTSRGYSIQHRRMIKSPQFDDRFPKANPSPYSAGDYSDFINHMQNLKLKVERPGAGNGRDDTRSDQEIPAETTFQRWPNRGQKEFPPKLCVQPTSGFSNRRSAVRSGQNNLPDLDTSYPSAKSQPSNPTLPRAGRDL